MVDRVKHVGASGGVSFGTGPRRDDDQTTTIPPAITRGAGRQTGLRRVLLLHQEIRPRAQVRY